MSLQHSGYSQHSSQRDPFKVKAAHVPPLLKVHLQLPIKAKTCTGLQDPTWFGCLPPLCPSLAWREILPLLNPFALDLNTPSMVHGLTFHCLLCQEPSSPTSPMVPSSFPWSLCSHTTLSVRLSLKKVFPVAAISPSALHMLTLLYFFNSIGHYLVF